MTNYFTRLAARVSSVVSAPNASHQVVAQTAFSVADPFEPAAHESIERLAANRDTANSPSDRAANAVNHQRAILVDPSFEENQHEEHIPIRLPEDHSRQQHTTLLGEPLARPSTPHHQLKKPLPFEAEENISEQVMHGAETGIRV